MDYEIITVSRYQGDGTTEKAVEVFSTTTGEAVAIVRRAWVEAKADWIARAFRTAEERVAA